MTRQRLRSGDAPRATRAAGVFCVPGGGRKNWGVPLCLQPALAVAPAELGSPVPAGLHRPCPPARATTTAHILSFTLFLFPFFIPFFFFFFPFFSQELPRPSDPRQPHTAHVCTLSPDLHLSLLVHAHVWPCNVHFPVCLPIIFYITSGELVPEESRRRSC